MSVALRRPEVENHVECAADGHDGQANEHQDGQVSESEQSFYRKHVLLIHGALDAVNSIASIAV